MALTLTQTLNLLKGQVYKIQSIQEGYPLSHRELTFDSIITTSVTGSCEVATVPLESNTSMTDYKWQNPTEITVKTVISRNGNILRGGVVGALTGGADNLIRSYLDILNLWKNDMSHVIQINTRNGTYGYAEPADYWCPQGYTVKSFSVSESKDLFNLFECEITFSQIMRPDYDSDRFRPNKKANMVTAALGVLLMSSALKK